MTSTGVGGGMESCGSHSFDCPICVSQVVFVVCLALGVNGDGYAGIVETAVHT